MSVTDFETIITNNLTLLKSLTSEMKGLQKLYKKKFDIKQKIIFKHGKTQLLPNGLIILSSYHPSPRNVNTKLISNKMMINLFEKAKKLAKF